MATKAKEDPFASVDPAEVIAPLTVNLGGPLDGHWIKVDLDKLSVGMLADLGENKLGPAIQGMSEVVIEGDLFKVGESLDWLRHLNMARFTAVCEAITMAFSTVPKGK